MFLARHRGYCAWAIYTIMLNRDTGLYTAFTACNPSFPDTLHGVVGWEKIIVCVWGIVTDVLVNYGVIWGFITHHQSRSDFQNQCEQSHHTSE